MDFATGSSILEEIAAARVRCDRAIFIFSEDDPLEGINGQAAPRDNVVFEVGYFVAARGARNTLIIRVGNAKMPADLGGIIYLTVPSLTGGPGRIEARIRDFAVRGLS
jgi:predicted nucleotide-binding protein